MLTELRFDPCKFESGQIKKMENARRRAKRTARLRLVTFGNLLISTGSQTCKVQSAGKR